MKAKEVYNENYWEGREDLTQDSGIFFGIAQKISYLFEKDTLIDLGCGFGHTLKHLLNLGFNAWGADVSEVVLGNLPKSLENRIAILDFTQPSCFASLPSHFPKKFKLLFSWNVLEHIPEERIDFVIQNFNEILSPQGYLVLAIDLKTNGDPTHILIKSREWWLQKFKEHSFEVCSDYPIFNSSFFVLERRSI